MTDTAERLAKALEPLAGLELWTDTYPDGPQSYGDNWDRKIPTAAIREARAALAAYRKERPNG